MPQSQNGFTVADAHSGTSHASWTPDGGRTLLVALPESTFSPSISHIDPPRPVPAASDTYSSGTRAPTRSAKASSRTEPLKWNGPAAAGVDPVADGALPTTVPDTDPPPIAVSN